MQIGSLMRASTVLVLCCPSRLKSHRQFKKRDITNQHLHLKLKPGEDGRKKFPKEFTLLFLFPFSQFLTVEPAPNFLSQLKAKKREKKRNFRVRKHFYDKN